MSKPENIETTETDPSHYGSVSPYKAGLTCCCPHCGEGALYKSGLYLNETCPHCGFDLSAADAGDGAQLFVIMILGTLCTILGFILYSMQIPMWAIMLVLSVFIIGGTYLMLRVFKATLVALQFYHDASEGKLNKDEPDDAL